MKAIVTIPPYAPFIEEVVFHPAVCGVRLNTVMPRKGTIEDLLKTLKTRVGDKDLWIDLKGRQLRVKTYGVPPFTEIELSHSITVNTPTRAYFSDGTECATVLAVDGNRLIMQEGPRKVVGPGEAVNIPDESLTIDGFLTESDTQYIAACRKVGLDKYMLSFVESDADVISLRKLVGDAVIVAKIESRKGINYVRERKEKSRLMAARGDLFVEVGMPHEVVCAVEEIVRADPKAIVASRIFPSLAHSYEPSCSDIGDVDNLMRMGYQTFMFGDDICMKRESILSGLNLFYAMAARYE